MTDSPRAIALEAPLVRPKIGGENWLMRVGLGVVGVYLLIATAFPLYAILSKSFQDKADHFVGLANYAEYFATPALFHSIYNSLTVSVISMVITVGVAFGYAYGLTRSCMRLKWLFRAIALIPILAPSLLPAISLRYLFGTQGMLKELMFGHSIRDPILVGIGDFTFLIPPLGIIIGEAFWTFPHALLIIVTALSLSDARLYEAAESLGTSKLRTFFTVTLPGAKYGLISACFVVFTLVITDFGVPKVVGGQYNVLAVDVYKQVIGQQNFQMGAVVGMVLLAPALLAFTADRLVQRRQVALLTARAVPYEPKPSRRFDGTMLAFCGVVSFAILGILATAQYAALVKLWPYNLSLTLYHYDFDLRDGGSWGAMINSLQMASWTAVVGTAIIFTGAYLVEKSKGFEQGRALIQLMCMVPLAVPGIVLGLAYIFFFNHPANPLGFIYGTMAILVICTITHFYTVSHLTAVTALKQMDPEFEAVSSSLKVPFYKTFARVTVPVCLPAILDISVYLFVNAMTTVSAVIFLYASDTQLASVAVINMDDAGEIASAAAMAMMIVYTSAGVRLLHFLFTRGLARRAQAWRKR
ncbi:MAG: putative 2-aminoethylphosphonate ABC transporter permease subunit [Alphaproteobacteria bacterium]